MYTGKKTEKRKAQTKKCKQYAPTKRMYSLPGLHRSVYDQNLPYER